MRMVCQQLGYWEMQTVTDGWGRTRDNGGVVVLVGLPTIWASGPIRNS
jgi:hypothetical protein